MAAPRSVPISEFARAYANVRDFGAAGDGTQDDTDFIQRAIDNADGKHVLFPQGDTLFKTDHYEIMPYRIEGTLHFRHDGQRTLFLAGAFLQLVTDGTSVQITGKAQEFTGLRIQTGTARYDGDVAVTAIPDPCLLIDGADGLLLSDLYVACGSAAVLVRIENTVGIAIQGGKIYGVTTSGNSGLVFGGGVRQFGALCLTIDNSSYGVIFEGAAETIAFENSDFEQQAENAILLRPGAFVRGLSLISLHTESGYGALRAIVVESGAGVYGAIIAGCEFGNLREDADEPRRVFDIAGDWHGVNVLGCYHLGSREWDKGAMGPDGVVYEAVYELRSTASVSQSCDMFNHWDHIEVATGDNKASLPVLQNDTGGNMVFTTSGISVAASRIGVFGGEPVTRRGTYYVRPFNQTPLAMLLRGLAQLGLIGCEVY